MKRRTVINVLFLVPALAFLLTGCSQDAVSPDGGRRPAKAESYFPLQTGNYWEYDFYFEGSLQNSIRYAIIDTVTHTDGNLLYIQQQDDYPDTCAFKYYTLRDEGIYYYTGATETSEDCLGHPYPTVKRKIMLSEMRPGDRWHTYDFPLSDPGRFTVRTGLSLHVGDYFFSDVILVIERKTYGTDYLYYAKDVGLVKGIYNAEPSEYGFTSVLEIDDYYVHSADTIHLQSLRRGH